MENIIKSIDRTSPLHGRAHPGDILVSINGNKIIDVLDYKYYAYDEKLEIVLRTPTGEERKLGVRAGLYLHDGA